MYTNTISNKRLGMSFKIFDHDRLSKEVIPKHFRHGHISSLQRQLNLYGFRHKGIYRGDDKGSFFHPMFIRGRLDLVEKIKRYNPNTCKKSGKGRGGSAATSDYHKSSSSSSRPSRRNPPRERKNRLSSDSVDCDDEDEVVVNNVKDENDNDVDDNSSSLDLDDENKNDESKDVLTPVPYAAPRMYMPKQPVDVVLGPPLKSNSTNNTIASSASSSISTGNVSASITTFGGISVAIPHKLGVPVPQLPVQSTMYNPLPIAFFPAKTKRSALTARLGFVLKSDTQAAPRVINSGGEFYRNNSFDNAIATFAEKHPNLVRTGSLASIDINFGEDFDVDLFNPFADDTDSSFPVGGFGMIL